MKILHVIDPTTSEDAIEILSDLVTRQGDTARVLSLGHDAVRQAAISFGVPDKIIETRRAMGWADPVGWRNISLAVGECHPEIIHVWGTYGLMGASLLRHFSGKRVMTLAHTPTVGQMKLMRILRPRGNWKLVVSSSTIWRRVCAGGWPEEELERIRPGIALGKAQGGKGLREKFGLSEQDWPVILLAGPSCRAARHDHGLWAAAIVQQMYPKTKVLWRKPKAWESGQELQLQEFMRSLPSTEMVIQVAANSKWNELAQVADLLLVSADESIPVGSILWTMACRKEMKPAGVKSLGSGVPVVGTALEEISELVEHQNTGLLVPVKRSHQHGGPKALAARIEEILENPEIAWKLTDQARAQIYEHFKPPHQMTY